MYEETAGLRIKPGLAGPEAFPHAMSLFAVLPALLLGLPGNAWQVKQQARLMTRFTSQIEPPFPCRGWSRYGHKNPFRPLIFSVISLLSMTPWSRFARNKRPDGCSIRSRLWRRLSPFICLRGRAPNN
jgi:hypothetical protein